DAWQKCWDRARKHDGDVCDAYREQIDTLLVFAGLFSAIVTAFAVDSYKWLQADPDPVILLAQLLSALQANNRNDSSPMLP
ncbi:hypothetical protein AURDEDRAFT_21678, partial [Auricularia subglabra TFB-10046 SS5]